MRVIFVRHGESQANLRHVISNRGLQHGLTPKGREQAHVLALTLKNQKIIQIYSSPLLRAIETSVILANQLSIDYEIVDALREYDCGILEGHSDIASWQRWHELFDRWTVHKDWDYRLESGESFHDIQNRFVPFIDLLIRRHVGTDADILCVSHGGIYRLMLPLVVRNIDDDTIKFRGLDYTACIITEASPDGLICVEWNGKAVD